MEPVSSDECLMQMAARGDLAAFEQLVLRHQESVWRTAYRMLGRHGEAEDIAQEAFLRVFEARERYRPTAAFRTFPRITSFPWTIRHLPNSSLPRESKPKLSSRQSVAFPRSSGRLWSCDITRGSAVGRLLR